MINSFKNPAIMRILRTTERYEAGWREQNFIPDDEVIGQIKSVKSRVSAITSCDLLQIYYKFATHNTE